MSRIQESLNHLFQQNRLIFWYDPEVNLTEEFGQVDLEDVTKLTVENNEFALKYQMMRQEPKRKFLIYLPYERPSTQENWLLDLELAGKIFHADAKSIMLREMGMREEDRPLLDQFAHFFKYVGNRRAFTSVLNSDDTEEDSTLKMLAVLCKTEPSVDAILLALIDDKELATSSTMREITQCGLEKYLWTHIQKYLNLSQRHETLTDLLVDVFAQATPLKGGVSRHPQCSVFLNRWKDSAQHRKTFESLSEKVAEILDVQTTLQSIESPEPLAELDNYKWIDLCLIVRLKEQIQEGKGSLESIYEMIQQRTRSFWYQRYHHIYACLLSGAELLNGLEKADFTGSDANQLIYAYTAQWFKMDGHHRRLLFHLRSSNQHSQLASFVKQIEGRYLNEFLRPVNQRFSQNVSEFSRWESSLTAQREFFVQHVQPFIQKKKKVFVIISDALRFEVAHELMNRVHQQDRFKAKLSPMLASLPSYTQLGMASLLPLPPRSEVTINSKDATVKVNGQSASGLQNRAKILAAGTSARTCALKLEAFLKISQTEGRKLAHDHDVIYLYHNGIDAVGDKRETEDKLPEAVEQEIERLLASLKKVAAFNGSHMLITADHGFLYQGESVEEAEFTSIDKSGFSHVSRRFAISESGEKVDEMISFSASELNLAGNETFYIPKGTQRLKVQGAGAKFVHGGCSLQEVITPVLHVSKSRDSDTAKTEVDIIRSGVAKITTTEVMLRFFQLDPVGEKVLPRRLKIAFYGQDGTQISELKELIFHATDSDARLREQKISIMLSQKADAYLNQDIYLKLSEPVPDSSHSTFYKDFTFRYEKHFTSDFEDF